jgi:hypothetical protein
MEAASRLLKWIPGWSWFVSVTNAFFGSTSTITGQQEQFIAASFSAASIFLVVYTAHISAGCFYLLGATFHLPILSTSPDVLVGS